MRQFILLISGCVSGFAADTVYIGGITARGRDVVEQTRGVLRALDDALDSAKLTRAHVVSTNVYLTDLRLLHAADVEYRKYFRQAYPARTVLQASIDPPDARIAISAVATRDLAARKVIHPPGWTAPAQPSTHAVLAGDTLFFSGGVPINPRDNSFAGDTIHEQVDQVMRNQEDLLKAAGLTFADLVFTRIHLANPADYAGLNDVYRKFVVAPPPARATVGGFPIQPGHLIQLQSLAVRGSGLNRPSGEGHTSPIHSFSVRAGRRLFITGMTGRVPDGGYARNDIAEQTRQALATIEEQLSRHNMTFADVIDSVVWLRDVRLASGMDEVYRRIVKGKHARTVVGVPPTSFDALVEIMMIAGL